MNPLLHLRLLTRADIPFADSLRASAGWNQTRADWERFIALAPEGCFIAEWDGQPVGTASTIIHGGHLAWIGMMLVHPEFRRRGIGRALLLRCIDYLQKRGIQSIKLDATRLGKKVYDGLGFKEQWSLTRWQHEERVAAPGQIDPRIRRKRWIDADFDAIEKLDIAAFGASRRALLQHLLSACPLTLEASRDIAGYGALREGSRAFYLGPVVAFSPDSGVRLIEALLEQGKGKAIYWDIPDENRDAVELAKRRHFTPQRPLVRMYLGENVASDPLMQFAIAGPEVG